MILNILKDHPITPMEALDKVGCFRLAARIDDLRSMGHTIRTEMVQSGDTRYARYHLEK